MQIKMKNICIYRFFFVTLRDFVIVYGIYLSAKNRFTGRSEAIAR